MTRHWRTLASLLSLAVCLARVGPAGAQEAAPEGVAAPDVAVPEADPTTAAPTGPTSGPTCQVLAREDCLAGERAMGIYDVAFLQNHWCGSIGADTDRPQQLVLFSDTPEGAPMAHLIDPATDEGTPVTWTADAWSYFRVNEVLGCALDGDPELEVVVAAIFMTGIGPEAAQEFLSAAVLDHGPGGWAFAPNAALGGELRCDGADFTACRLIPSASPP